MANFATLKAAINAVIKTNGNKEITGEVLNQVLNAMVTSLGANYQFAGVATPSTNPGTPDQNVFYMATEAGTYTNFNATVLPAGISILLWNGSWSHQTFFEIDSVPTSGSDNFISSGAVFEKMKLDGGAYDVSAHNGGATFASLSALLSSDNLNTLIPVDIRHGGMSIKFVQSSDNKYVQWRYMLKYENTTDGNAAFANYQNWQGVDDALTANSNNLSKSGSAYQIKTQIGYYTCTSGASTQNKTITVAGYAIPSSGGSIKVKFNNKNIATEPTFNINGTGAKPLFYNGKIASADNTWLDNEIVEIFYDGTNYQAYKVIGISDDGIFNISAYNAVNDEPATYESLEAALGIGNTYNIPNSYRKGGMYIKFLLRKGAGTEQDPYVDEWVQYRSMSKTYSKTVSVWQGVDRKISQTRSTSRNLIENGAVSNEFLYYGAEINLGADADTAAKVYTKDVTATYITTWNDGFWQMNGTYNSDNTLKTSNRFQLPRGGYLFDMKTFVNVAAVRLSDADNNTVRLFAAHEFNIGTVAAAFKFLFSSIDQALYVEISQDPRYTDYPKIYVPFEDNIVRSTAYNNDKEEIKNEIATETQLEFDVNDAISMDNYAYIDGQGEYQTDSTHKYNLSDKIYVKLGEKFAYGLVSYATSIITLYDANDNILDINDNTDTYTEGVYTINNSNASYIYFGYRVRNSSVLPSGKEIYVKKLNKFESLKDFVIGTNPQFKKTIYLFGDSISSSNYPWYKEYLEKYTGANVLTMGSPGRTTGYLAKNVYFNNLATVDFDICVALTGANDSGNQGSVGTFSADTELYSMGEPIVTEPSIDVTDYDDTDKKLIQSISYIIRKWIKLYWNFRLKANLNACILDTENNYDVVYPLSGTATEQECMDYAETQGWGEVSYGAGRYILRTTETPESKREKLMSVKHPKLYYCTTFPRRINTPEDWHSDPVRSERKRLAVIECCKKYGIPCIDLAKEWAIQWDEEPCFYDERSLSEYVTDNKGIYTMDGVHPNEFGYEWIARIVAKVLNA